MASGPQFLAHKNVGTVFILVFNQSSGTFFFTFFLNSDFVSGMLKIILSW